MTALCETASPTRRSLLAAGAGLFAWAFAPRFAHAAGGRDLRLVTIVLRGALDGLSAVAPVGDPDYAGLHGALALSLSGDHPALPLDGFFALDPAMPVLARLFAAKQAAVVHAVATGYRERSHFDGQDVLESGQPVPGLTQSGWLNRALLALPAGERVAPTRGLAVGAIAPLVIRGDAPVLGWAPQAVPTASDDLARRVLELYGARDPSLHAAMSEGLSSGRMAGNAGMKPAGGMNTPQGMRQAAEGAARLLAAEDGPRVAALAFDGWDTHVAEGGATGTLARLLGGLDGAFDAFHSGLGPAWNDTAILVATEFGRTARINGTTGTDHGTGTVALVVGGAVRGGRVIADWPGLKPAQLLDNRDLRPTTDLRALFKGVLASQWGVPERVLATEIFPGSEAIAPAGELFV